MRKFLSIAIVSAALILVTVTLTACSLPAPRNVRQDGWYLRWEQPQNHLASGYTAQFRRSSSESWWTMPKPPPPLRAGELNLQRQLWVGGPDGYFYSLQDDDQIRIRLTRTGVFHSVQTSRWVTITFRIPD